MNTWKKIGLYVLTSWALLSVDMVYASKRSVTPDPCKGIIGGYNYSGTCICLPKHLRASACSKVAGVCSQKDSQGMIHRLWTESEGKIALMSGDTCNDDGTIKRKL